jgi:hypothetical protein
MLLISTSIFFPLERDFFTFLLFVVFQYFQQSDSLKGTFLLSQKPGFSQFRASRAPASALVHFVHSLAVAACGAATILCALRFIVLLNDMSTGKYFS